MQVIFGADGYVDSYAVVGSLVDGVEVTVPEDIQHFEENFRAYKQDDTMLVFDEEKAAELAKLPDEPTLEERMADMEEAFALLVSGVTE